MVDDARRSNTHRLYAAEVSLYSGKARAYLRYKGIPFEEVLATRQIIEKVVYPRTGMRMIPIVVTPDDVAVQDTSEIIDFLEQRFPEAPVLPSTPRQRLVALLFELFGDEWLLLPAMHHRWQHPRENLLFILREFGGLIAPRWPGFSRPVAGLPLALIFGGVYGRVLGISRKSQPALEALYEDFLRAFDTHLEHHPFLLGTRPSIGDFGLMGPLYAHLYRDPFPGRLMRSVAPRVADWVERMNEPDVRCGSFLDEDLVPETLDPILRMIFTEQFPQLADTVTRVHEWSQAHPGKAFPRFIGDQSFSIGGIAAPRKVTPYSQWMLQRPLSHYESLSGEALEQAHTLLQRVGGLEAMQIRPLTRVRRLNNRVVPAAPE